MKTKSKVGRKSKYPTHVQPNLDLIKSWKMQGYLEESMCNNLGVSVSQFNEYKNKYPELKEALKEGKEHVKAMIISKLYENIEEGDTSAIIFGLKTICGFVEQKDRETLKIRKEELEIKKKEVVKEDKQVIININNEDVKKVEAKKEKNVKN